MATLKAVQAAINKKQADLDMMDDQIMGMPEMAPDVPTDMGTSPEFDLLTEKREQLEEEIQTMREGVQLITEWEKFKGGQWSEEVKGLLGEIDIEISDIAGGEVASPDAGLDMAAPMGMDAPMDMGAPTDNPGDNPADLGVAEPPVAAPVEPPAAAAPVAPEAEVAPLEAPLASVSASKSTVSKKNNYQSPDKKGIIAHSDPKKEDSNMATPTPAKASQVKEKLAEVKSKRDSIKKEAQQRVAAAWTIAKTMLPSAPAEVQKSAASNLLSNSTKVLNAMLRQTAKNAHYTKIAEEVHKKEMNDLMAPSSELTTEQHAVTSELKGEAKNAGKTADDRKDAGPQDETYNDGRGCGGGKHSEPKEMDAGSSSSQTEAEHRPDNTINKSDGDKKASKSAAAEACKCEGDCKCSAKKEKEASEKHAGHKSDCDCNFCENKGGKKDEAKADDKKEAAAKTADDMPMMDAPTDAPPMEAAPEEAPMDAAPEEAPIDTPVEDVPEGGDTPGEVLSDEKKMVVEEKIEEAQEAIKSLEQEILQEGEEELDLSQVFNEDGTATEEMEEKVSALANESEEHTAGNGEEYFAPSAAESMEAGLDEPQMASMEDFFSLRGSDSDPLRALIAGEIRTAADVAGMDVIPTSTGELANAMESDSAKGETRDNESDHDGDLFAEAIENEKPEDGGFKRVKQDETNEMQAPKAAAKTATTAPAKSKVISKLKPVVASETKQIDIASALFGSDEF